MTVTRDAAVDSLPDRLRVAPGASVDLRDHDPRETFGIEKEAAEALLADAQARLADLQERLWASEAGPLLIVLQGIDTSGKDGVIRHVVGSFDPLGCQVVAFGVPTDEERGHDFLWRIHREVPRKGRVTVFNRSHYEDVLVVRVRGLAPEEVWRPRYERINEFERLLADSGTTIVKCFLNISRDEQRERFQARIDDPEKRWKFRLGDLDDRAHWDDYMAAYAEVLERCSTDAAPWYVIPADRKWFRNVAVARILVRTLERLELGYPEGEPGTEGLVVT